MNTNIAEHCKILDLIGQNYSFPFLCCWNHHLFRQNIIYSKSVLLNSASRNARLFWNSFNFGVLVSAQNHCRSLHSHPESLCWADRNTPLVLRKESMITRKLFDGDYFYAMIWHKHLQWYAYTVQWGGYYRIV